MRIKIELEVAPDEAPLATELLAVLRGLTDHVTVRTSDPATASSLQAAAPAAIAPATPANAQPPMPALGPQPVAPAALAPPAAGPPPLQPLVPAAAPAPSTFVPPPAAGAAGGAGLQPVLSFPPGTTPTHMYEAILLAAEHDPHPEQLARQLESIFLNSSLGTPLDLVREFAGVWKRMALDPSLLAQERSAYPFVALIAHLNKELSHRIRDMIVSDMLKHLTAKRAVTVDRAEFYVQAEAFAALVALEIVGMEGAVQTMAALLRKPENRAAAVTMLGKTVDLANQLMLEKVSQKVLTLMRDNVTALTEPEFQYDREFILDSMGWGAGAAGAHAAGAAAPAADAHAAHAAAPARAGPLQLRPYVTGLAHSDMVFGLALDTRHRQLVSGGKDIFLQVWTDDGKQVQQLDLGGRYVSTMDYHPKLGLLLCTGLANSSTPGHSTTFLAGFAASEPHGFVPRGFISRPHTSQVSCIKALPDTSGFISAETNLASGAAQQDILYWDVAAGGSFSSLQPVQVFRGHTDIVTTLSRFTPNPSLFLSGSKDSTVLLWDSRQPNSVAQVGRHNGMVTCLEAVGAQDYLLFSGSTDRTVKIWDLRSLSTNSPTPPLASVDVANMVVLKVAACPSYRTAVVSAMSGVFQIDYTNPAAPVLSKVEWVWPEGRTPGAYHDIKWNEERGILYAAGKDKHVDLYISA